MNDDEIDDNEHVVKDVMNEKKDRFNHKKSKNKKMVKHDRAPKEKMSCKEEKVMEMCGGDGKQEGEIHCN